MPMFEYEKRMVQNDIIALLVNCQVWKMDVCPSNVRFFRAMPDSLLTYEEYLTLTKNQKVAYDFFLHMSPTQQQWRENETEKGN